MAVGGTTGTDSVLVRTTKGGAADRADQADAGEGTTVDEDCWERSLDVSWRRTATGVVLLPATSTVAYALDGLAARCWEALGRPLGLAALADEVHADPEADDLAEVVRFLVTIGVARACVPSTS